MCLLLLCGGWIGWRIVDRNHEPRPTTGFYRGTTQALRVSTAGLGLAFGGGALRWLSVYLDSDVLGWISVSGVALGIGVCWGAGIRSWMGD